MQLGALVAAVAIAASAFAPTSNGSCNGGSPWQGECSVSNNGSQVDLGASRTNPGSTAPTTDRGSPTYPAATSPELVEPDCDSPLCRGNYTVVTIPDVTIADLASFRPAVPTLTGEPEGFGVVGMPVNVVAAASEQHLPGTLLGWDVVVRFVPAAYLFDYGDGSTTHTRTGGATWPRLGQAQFTPTATSHVYRARGTYAVGVTVQYAASVDFGTGWRPVPGFVSASTAGYDVQVVEVRTALVDRTCVENPSGPGC